jgi:phytoene dehydrogenase-like protein
VAQQSLFDSTRAPTGRHTGWAYCHVPNGASFNTTEVAQTTEAIESQVERFAPGFRERILGRSALTPLQLESENANLVGGDIAGGSTALPQMFFRPTSWRYRTPAKELYLCSASTPPGPGVHGLCGYYAAREAVAAVEGKQALTR